MMRCFSKKHRENKSAAEPDISKLLAQTPKGGTDISF